MNRLVIQVIQGNLVLSSICRSKFLQKQYPPKGIKLFIPPRLPGIKWSTPNEC